MICFPAPVEVAVVDRIESHWALVELGVGRFVEVQTSRLPLGAKEGDEVCFCSRPGRNQPWIFEGCSSKTQSFTGCGPSYGGEI